MGDDGGEVINECRIWAARGGAVDEDEACGAGGELGGEGDDGRAEHGEGSLFPLADNEEVVPALAMESGIGGAFDGIRCAEPATRGDGGSGGLSIENDTEIVILGDVGGGIALEDDRVGWSAVALLCKLLDAVKGGIALVIGEPHDLEGAIALYGTGGVIVDAFTGTGEEPWGGVVFIHDEVGVCLIALEGDADDHLPERGAGEGIGTAEGL